MKTSQKSKFYANYFAHMTNGIYQIEDHGVGAPVHLISSTGGADYEYVSLRVCLFNIEFANSDQVIFDTGEVYTFAQLRKLHGVTRDKLRDSRWFNANF